MDHKCKHYLSASCHDKLEEHWAHIFHSLVLRGNLRTTVRWVTECKKGGVIQPKYVCTKTGEHVLDVI